MFQEFYSRVLAGGIKPDTRLVAPLFIKMISRRFELTICSLRGYWPKPLVEETLNDPGGIWTHDFAVKGQWLRPLVDGASICYFYHKMGVTNPTWSYNSSVYSPNWDGSKL